MSIFLSLNRVVNSAQSARFRTGGEISAVAIVKDVRQLGCVSQDAEPPESSAILRKGPKILGPIRRVRFTKTALRQADIRESKGPSLKKILVQLPHQRSPYALKFEDRSQDETERQERCARGDTWRMGQKYPKAQRKGQSYLFLTYHRMVSPSAVHNKTGGQGVGGGQRERFQLCSVGNRKGL